MDIGRAMLLAADALHVPAAEIRNVTRLTKGMTNLSVLFDCGGERYIMRIPGEGTDALIDRRQEAEAYRLISGRSLCDDVVYIEPENGCKITKFVENVRVCDPGSHEDVRRCMEKLRQLHALCLQTDYTFDIFEKIDFYESLWDGAASRYGDYAQTKANVFSLRPYIEAHAERKCFTHIDAVPDNFLFSPDGHGGERLQLIDWEYAGMQDPHVDPAMFCIYAMYDRTRIDWLIDIYFEGNCEEGVRKKIYCYIAACGLLWSNWCEYKRSLGVDFGEYALRQYDYAREYGRLARTWIDTGDRTV